MTNAERQRTFRERQALRNGVCNELLPILLEIKGILETLRNAVTPPFSPPLGFPLDSLPTPPLIPPKNHGQKRSQSSLPAAPYSEDFEVFWKAYPHRIGKKDAFNKFQKAMKAGVSLQALLDGIEVYVAHKPADCPYCNPSTWLNQERWNDEYATNGSGVVSAYRPPSSPPPAPNQHYDG